jgi:hypothetical protein
MADSKDLFNRLKKMFSTDVIVRNVGGKKIKVVDTDEIQYATDRNSLRDRFNRLRSSTYNLHNRDMSMAYQAARLELFRDYDVMDMDPIIASALDIYADECLSGETTILLMDGRKLSIEELYRRNEKNFWVYSVDSSGKFCPQLCERVAYNGEKPMVKITLCDGTEVKCTKNHIWVLSDGNQVETNKLMVGSSLKAFSTKILVSIEECGTHGAYDLVNVGDSHIYAIEANDGSKIFTHNCLVPSEFGHVLTIRSQNENIKQILENLFNDILNIEFNLWSWTRNMCKYGDFFLRLEISPEYGVYLVHPISPYELTRVEGSDPKNINYVKFQHDGLGGGMEYENFEIAHFRLLSDSNFLPYGKSMIEPARRVWKQLSLMEDAMLIHRIMRAPEKRIFSIDVGNLPPSDIDATMQKVISQVKKVPYIDEKTGDYNLRFNLNNMVEDFYLPVRGGDSGTKIDTLPGMDFTGIDDLEYVRNKMMAALKIPKAFLGYDETISGKATLAAEDVRFSRTIGRIQRILVSELTKIAIVHLYVQGYQDASLVDFELELSNPSTIFEQEKIAIWQDKMNVAKDMTDSEMFSRKWVYNKIFNMSSDDIEGMEDEVIKDKKQEWRRQQIKDEGNDPATSNQKVGGDSAPEDLGGGMSDLGGGGGESPDAGGGDDTGADTGGDAGGGELPPLEEETRKDRERGNRDQTGNKEKYTSTTDKNWGEDPLGAKENKEKSKSDRSIRHTYRGSPLSLEEDLKNITSTLKKRYKNQSKTVITEKKSLLDESNIISEDKPI